VDRQACRRESRRRGHRLVAARQGRDLHHPSATRGSRDDTRIDRRNSAVTRILVVEDEASLSEPLAYLLEREGYEVAVAPDGPSALREFDQRGADLLLLDLMLPGMSGTDVCRDIRSRSQVPIIMLTAKDGE